MHVSNFGCSPGLVKKDLPERGVFPFVVFYEVRWVRNASRLHLAGVIFDQPRKNADKKQADLLQMDLKCFTLRRMATPGTFCAKLGQDSLILY